MANFTPLNLVVMRCLMTTIALFGALVALAQGDGQFAPNAALGLRLENASYKVDFDEQGGVAHWVHYALTAQEATGSIPRKDAFRGDPRVGGSPDEKSYAGSGYDRGHLKPAADSRSSAEEMRNSFLMTNMAPQTPNLNRGIWKELEEAVRGWAVAYGTVHVSCGPGLETDDVLASGVRVPDMFWKAILRTAPDTSCVAFVFPNAEKVPGELGGYQMSVDALEQILSMDLFSALPDGTEARVESEVVVWPAVEAAPVQSVLSPSQSGAKVQCMGIAKSTGRRCQKTTTDPSGYCHLHR